MFKRRTSRASSEAELPPVPGARESLAAPGQSLPLIIKPGQPGLDLVPWADQHRGEIRRKLLRHGGIVFRDFPDVTVPTFHALMSAVSGDPLDYVERSSPRHEISERVYTSTDYPPAEEIYLHNEQSYNVTWPLQIFFHCVIEPAANGGTPLADCRRVYQRITAPTRKRLADRGYCYARHFTEGFGLSWREAFQTDDPHVVEKYCLDNDISWTWGSDGALTTRQVRPVIATHPQTGERTWFNHLTFFNVSTFGTEIAEALLSMGKERLPNNTYYGDGADIEPAVLDELRAAYQAEKVVVPWRQGDVMMLDNMLVAHGREAFTPPREIVVGMTEPQSR